MEPVLSYGLKHHFGRLGISFHLGAVICVHDSDMGLNDCDNNAHILKAAMQFLQCSIFPANPLASKKKGRFRTPFPNK
jgi:hypothetical protein